MEEYTELELERTWPLFGLSIAHRDLLLREATDDDVLALARVVEGESSRPATNTSCLAYCSAERRPLKNVPRIF